MPHVQLVRPARRRLDKTARVVRAAWRDTSALLHEFRRPLIAFHLALFGGGLLYGFLHNNVAGIQPPIPITNMPYTILALMVLETPESPPPQPYLIVFWYLMPAVAVYVIGRGAVDFGRLFFDRSGRRDAWEAALASTYRNHIIVVGVGHVGVRVVRTLVSMGFEVVGVDIQLRPEVEAELGVLGVPVIHADARLPTCLQAAGLRYARSLVVCTSNDQNNIEITMRARDLNPDIRIVVRMWDNQFAEQLRRFMGVEAVLSASDLSAPAFAGSAVGIEITQSLVIHGIEYSMIRLEVAAGSFMDGATIDALQQAHEMDVVLHARAGTVDVHPDNNITVRAGDTLVIFARHSRIIDIVSRNQRRRAIAS